MKYGQTLRQCLIPAWSHHNIDYDDIKLFIKDRTTAGKGKTIAIPGRGDERLREFEDALFHIFADQHQRIDLFVKSKSGEIQRRLDHSRKRLRQLSALRTNPLEGRIPIGRLERYARLENDVIKAGDEIRSLARFVAIQRTAFRKLLKKYRKWTGSADLEDRFRDEVLDDLKSFTKLDLGTMLDDYSALRLDIKALYEHPMHSPNSPICEHVSESPCASSSSVRQLQEAVETGSKVFFDTSIATVPLGEKGTCASYFVHRENIVELQMHLLQYARYYLSRSRSNSIATPVAGSVSATAGNADLESADYHIMVADSLARFTQEQSSLTVNDREHLPGSFPQRAKASVRWNNTEDALVCLRSGPGNTKSAYLKKKHVEDFFDADAEFTANKEVVFAETASKVQDLRKDLLRNEVKPLSYYSSCRSRLVGLDDGPAGIVLATLDTSITIRKAGASDDSDRKSSFPFALLLVRQEGLPKTDLVAILDDSHLVERVRGFSLEYHSVWQTHRPRDAPVPFGLSILDRDIRKLPPPALKRSSATDRSGSDTRSAGSNESVGDSTTAVENYNDPPTLDETSPRALRKKKRRTYPKAETDPAPVERYWSEYDHPEEGDEAEAYYIFVDPNEKTAFDRFFENVYSLFSPRRLQQPNDEQQPLLVPPSTPHDDESSSDEDEGTSAIAERSSHTVFGTFAGSPSGDRVASSSPSLGTFTCTCFAASLALLAVAYALRSFADGTRAIGVGVLFALVCSLVAVALGFLSFLRVATRSDRRVSLAAWSIITLVLFVDAVGVGGLGAWMLG